MIYKTGHRDYPSLSTYTEMLQEDGAKSVKAEAYRARFLTDAGFVEQARVVKLAFESRENEESKNT